MPFTKRPGAVLDSANPQLVLHYGSLFPEQRALTRGGVVPRADTAVLRLSGADRLRWLDSISSQQLLSLTPRESTESLILDPHGHVQWVLRLVDDGEALWALTPVSHRDAVLTWLQSMRFRADVHIVDVSAEYTVVSVVGSIAIAPDRFSATVWRDPWPGVSPGGYGYASHARDWHLHDWIVPNDQLVALDAALTEHSISVAGWLALTALRIAAGRPDALDIDDRSLPHEFDWLRTAVHLSKGCYRGQETVAKVHNLGRPPRRLVVLHLDGSDTLLPAVGDRIWAEREGEPRDVGDIRAVAVHWELGPIALGLVKRAMPVTTALTVHVGTVPVAAQQEELVPSEAGPAVDLPRLRRSPRDAS
ncbi:MAG TPA: folate-binding protein [Microbacteriaceae bacterium]|nr:folate-binding protein [Microbacteriaceae bacterium]